MAAKSKRQREQARTDWVICNLRWLLLAMVGVAIGVEALAAEGGLFGSLPLLRQLVVLAVAVGYNLLNIWPKVRDLVDI